MIRFMTNKSRDCPDGLLAIQKVGKVAIYRLRKEALRWRHQKVLQITAQHPNETQADWSVCANYYLKDKKPPRTLTETVP